MSIINKMHQDFQQMQQAQPILASMPEKRSPQKALLLLAISLLLGTSLVLAYLIFSQDKTRKETAIQIAKMQPIDNPQLVTPKVLSKTEPKIELKVEAKTQSGVVQKKPKVEAINVTKAVAKEPLSEPLATAITLDNAAAEKKKSSAPKAQAVATKLAFPETIKAKTDPVKETIREEKQLEISVSQLSNAQLAQLHLKEADKAQTQGDFELAVRKKLQALALQPHLNEVRKSVALYYYGQGEVDRAQSLLKKGVLVSPDYPDFNLMLSRIALKEGDQQKAYLYLDQNPPKVEGNLDYYTSYAILAQKFQKYEQSERLYSSLLTQRPNNGRWRMSLAIVQDRLDKIDLAINNYKQALLQTDLSSKAKVYINQRLAYLGQN